MKPQDFMEALGGVSQEKLDALAKWQNAKTPIAGESPAKENRITQTADKPVFAVRRRGTMKQNTKKKASAAQINPWKIGVGVAVAACAAIAVFIGGGIISLDKQMQVGSNAGTSITEQLSEREPLPIEVRAADGIDIDMNLPEGGKAEVLRSVDDAQVWIDLLKQSGEYGRETGEGFHPCLEILEMEKEYLDHDIIMCAVPYHFMQSNSGVAQHAFFGGTITESGKLTVETGMVTVSKEMRPLILQDTETYCVCFTVPKNTVPEITGFTFNNQIYDCTAPLPDDIRSELDMTEYLAELPEYQGYAQRFTNELYLRWIEDDIQTADATDKTLPEDCTEVQSVDAAHEPVEIIARLPVYGGSDYAMIKVPPEGSVQVLRSTADAEALCQYQRRTVVGNDLKAQLTEDLFAEYDVLYAAFKESDLPQYFYNFDLAGGSIALDGKTLKLDFHALMYDPKYVPANYRTDFAPDTNLYYFYTVPKDSLPDLDTLEIRFEEYPIGEIPDELLAQSDELVDIVDNGYITKHTKLQEYLETTQEYLEWVESMPKPKYISWEDNTQLP